VWSDVSTAAVGFIASSGASTDRGSFSKWLLVLTN